MAEETAEVAPAAPAPAKSSGSPSIILILIIVLFSNAAGAGVTWFLVRKAIGTQLGATASEGKKEKEEVDQAAILEKSAVVPLEPFVVNLADADAPRYLRIKVSLMVDDKAKIKEVEENQALQLKVRDTILQTLTRKTSKDLIDEAGKNKLRKEIQDEVGPFFKTPKLNDVMFTEFVIQL